jgi:AcrR family transcriptional regulator
MTAQDLFETEEIKPSRKGRPRSDKATKKILDATNKLLLHMSVQELSIEAIAKKAKVGKTTIYRWWPNKTAVVMDALVSQPGMQSPMATAKDNTDAVVIQLEKLIRLLDSKNGEVIAQLFSESQNDEKSYKIFAENFLNPLIDALQYSVEQGQEDGEFSKSITSKLAVDMLCGPIFFRLLSHPYDFDDNFAKTFPQTAVQILKT